jgi:uncharacterized iron-regulated membrane protein
MFVRLPAASVAVRSSAPSAALYRSVWRWHFYAGLLVLPLLAWLAITGGLYLCKTEIERIVYADWISVAPGARPMTTEALIARVERQTGHRVTQVTRPAGRTESWRMTLTTADDARRTAFVDPRDGTVLGSTAHGGVMATVRSLHSLAITGPLGNALIEIVAGWTIVLVATGWYLWWPRPGQPVLALRGRPRRRLFWRDLHASTGFVLGGLVLFLALSGMPWSGVWGKGLYALMNTQSLARPAPPTPRAGAGHDDHGLPWSLRNRPAPRAAGQGDIGADRVVAVAARRGLHPPYTLTLPTGPDAPYVAQAVARRASDARVLYLAPADGAVLQDARFADFGRGAHIVEWGVAVHEGREFGEVNRLLMLAGCVVALMLAISAPILWWKRRFAAPPCRADDPRSRGLLALMTMAGVLFPLTGMTMLAALAFEAFARRRENIAQRT